MPFQSSPPHIIVPPVSLKPPPKIEKVKAVEEDRFSNKPITRKSSISSVKATVYSVADLQIATDSFSVENLIGEGTFGRVYRAQFSDGKVLEFKIHFQSRLHLVIPVNMLPNQVYLQLRRNLNPYCFVFLSRHLILQWFLGTST